MEDNTSSSSYIQEHSASKPLNLISVARKTQIPVMGSENWPSLADSLLEKRTNLKDEKQTKPAEVRGSTAPPASNLGSSSDAITIPPVSHSIATNSHKYQGSIVPPALSYSGSSKNPDMPSSPRSVVINADKGHELTVHPALAYSDSSKSLNMPPIPISVVINTDKGQGSALPPSSACRGSSNACVTPVSSSVMKTSTHKGWKSTVPSASARPIHSKSVVTNTHKARNHDFQPHHGHPPMQARLPGPWAGSGFNQICHLPWPPVHPGGNANLWYPDGYFGNFPNGVCNHLQGPNVGFNNTQQHQQAFNSLYDVNMHRPTIPWPPVMQASPFINPAPWFRNEPNFHVPSPASGVPRARPELAQVSPGYIRHPRNYETRTQASECSSLRIRIVKQIDYYFSDENLPRDYYLRKLMDKDGWVEIVKVAEFNKLRNMTTNIPFILEALRSSNLVEVQVNRIRRRDNWSKWVPKSILSSPEESKNPEGRVEDITVVNLKNHQSNEDGRVEDKTIVDIKNHWSSEDDRIEDKTIDDLKKPQSSEDGRVEDKTIDGLKMPQSSKGNTQKDSQQLMDFSSIADSLAVMVSKLSLEDDCEKVLSNGDESVEKIPDLIGSSQFVRCF